MSMTTLIHLTAMMTVIYNQTMTNQAKDHHMQVSTTISIHSINPKVPIVIELIKGMAMTTLD
jgi:hypothetical protein